MNPITEKELWELYNNADKNFCIPKRNRKKKKNTIIIKIGGCGKNFTL